jgi:PadR family transcriptional regulator, regulatory protein PadR
MPARHDRDRIELLQGTLDLLLLQTLRGSQAHGHAIARIIEGSSDRRAKFHRLTGRGRKQRAVKTSRWKTLVRALARVLRPAPQAER